MSEPTKNVFTIDQQAAVSLIAAKARREGQAQGRREGAQQSAGIDYEALADAFVAVLQRRGLLAVAVRPTKENP